MSMTLNLHNERRRAPWTVRLGYGAGRVWRGFLRREHEAVRWLAARGWSVGLAKALLLGAKALLLVALLYVAFWLAVVLALVVMCLWLIEHAQPGGINWAWEWRDGHSGYGLYDEYDSRRDLDLSRDDNHY